MCVEVFVGEGDSGASTHAISQEHRASVALECSEVMPRKVIGV